MLDAIYSLDYAVLDFIQNVFSCDFADFFMRIITHLGDGGLFWIAIAAVCLINKKTRKTGVVMGLALVIGVLVCNVTLKPLIARVRPYANENYAHLLGVTDLLIKAPSDYSFPSGHTLASFEGAVAILLCTDKKHRAFGIGALVIAFAVAFSRLYLYVHYFTDVAIGALLGTGFAFAAYFAVGAAEKKITAKNSAKRNNRPANN